MEVNEDSQNAKPLYLKIKEDLLHRIQSGEWRPGELLPSENALAAEYKVSVGTARRAVDELAAERLLVRQRGRGTVVAMHSHRQEMFRYYRLKTGNGVYANQRTEYLDVSLAKATVDEAKALGIPRGAAVTRVRRCRFSDNRPLVLEDLSLREDVLPGIGQLIKLHTPKIFYTLLERQFHIIVSRVEEKVSAVASSRADIEILDMRIGTPILKVERRAFDLLGRCIEYRIMRAHPEAYYTSEIS